jgi:preprotein translocase subunit SecG
MLYYLVATLYVLACFLLLLVVLLQQGKGGDIASAFGGGGSQTAFGARAGATVLTRATAVLGALFMVGAVLLAVLGRPGSGSLLRGTAAPAPPPVQTPLANPATNPVQPATTPQQQPTALPQQQPAPEQAKPGVAGTPQKPAGNPK